MPEVIVIDEIGTELEAQAARTIAERGVMLVATAHGNELANLIKNPTLSDLVGGIQSVTLGDEEARRRRTQKTVLERAADPTFPLAVEMHSRHRWLVHRDVARTVDLLLRGQSARPQIRELGADGHLQLQDLPPTTPAEPGPAAALSSSIASLSVRPRIAPRPLPVPDSPPAHGVEREDRPAAAPLPVLRVYGAGISRAQLEQVVRARQLPLEVVGSVELADAVLSLRQQLGRDPHVRRQAQELGLPILVLKSAAPPQLQRALERLLERHRQAQADHDPDLAAASLQGDDALAGLEECRLAVEQVVLPHGQPVELLPRSDRVRLMQAELASRYRLRTAVFGRGSEQRLRVFPA
jgi:hypothetical protein